MPRKTKADSSPQITETASVDPSAESSAVEVTTTVSPFGGDLVADAGGYLWIAFPDRHQILRRDPHGQIETVAGTGEPGYSGDGEVATKAMLDTPISITLLAGRPTFLDSGNRVIRQIDALGRIETIARL